MIIILISVIMDYGLLIIVRHWIMIIILISVCECKWQRLSLTFRFVNDNDNDYHLQGAPNPSTPTAPSFGYRRKRHICQSNRSLRRADGPTGWRADGLTGCAGAAVWIWRQRDGATGIEKQCLNHSPCEPSWSSQSSILCLDIWVIRPEFLPRSSPKKARWRSPLVSRTKA